MSIALPYSFDTQGEFAEKSLHAYGARAQAQFLLSQRVRSAFVDKGEGLYVFNTEPDTWSGWLRFPASAFRSNYQSVSDPKTGACEMIAFDRGMDPFVYPKTPEEMTPENDSQTFADNAPRQVARIWLQGMQGNTFRRLRLSTAPCANLTQKTPAAGVDIQVDDKSWPISLRWPGMRSSLILPGFGDFHSVAVTGFAPRARVHEIWDAHSAQQRDELRETSLRSIPAVEDGVATREDTGETIIYTQMLKHPRLGWAVRRLEIWKSQPHISLQFRLYRRSSELPEAFFLSFPLPVGNHAPTVSNAGVPYQPYRQQVPGSCKDYFATDGWVDFETANGQWLWVSRDAPLVDFGRGTLLAKADKAPVQTNIVEAILFDNLWHTNFVANAMGEMDFRFDLEWKPTFSTLSTVSGLAETLVSTPVLLLNPREAADPLYKQYIFQP